MLFSKTIGDRDGALAEPSDKSEFVFGGERDTRAHCNLFHGGNAKTQSLTH